MLYKILARCHNTANKDTKMLPCFKNEKAVTATFRSLHFKVFPKRIFYYLVNIDELLF